MKKIASIILIALSLNTFAQKRLQEVVDVASFAALNNKVYFSTQTQDKGAELWILDENTQELEILKDIVPGIGSSNPVNLVSFNGFVYFSADDRVHGAELWRTDGTEVNTTLFKDLIPGYRMSSNPSSFVQYNNKMYFLAADETIGSYRNLWVTDGTAAGTMKLYDLGGSFTSIVESGGNIYALKGSGLVKYSTATNSGSVINLDINSTYSNLVGYNNDIYFVGNSGNISLFKLSNSNTVELVREFVEPTSGDIEIDNVLVALGSIYLTIREDFNSSADKQTIWKSNGTTAGTVSVREFNWDRFLTNSDLASFYEFNGKLYFKAPFHLNEYVWETNGETSGTQLAFPRFLDRDRGFIGKGNTLYFASSGGSLWYADVAQNSGAKQFMNYSLTGSSFFKGQSDNHLYFEANNNGSLGNFPYYLYSSELRTSQEFELNNIDLEPNELITLTTELGKIAQAKIKVRNTGNSDLVFSSIEITGKGLYLRSSDVANFSTDNPSGIFPQVIPPDEEYTFGVFFYPSTNDFGNGKITIYSNSGDGLKTEFLVEGVIKENQGEDLFDDPTLNKEIIFFDGNTTPLGISSTSIAENQSANTLIGNFAITVGITGFTYELVGSNNDNSSFSITDNQLLTGESFDFESQNTYTIRVKASNGTVEHERDFIIQVTDEHEDLDLGECVDDVFHINAGFSDVIFLSDTKAIAVGEEGNIIKSEDGGTTWQQISTNTKLDLQDLDFPTNTIGYAVGRGVFLKTEDGGESWFELSIPQTVFDYPDSIFFLDENVGFAYGISDANIFKTVNGGLNWTKYTVSSSENLQSMHFIDSQNGFVSGRNRFFSKTTDGGETWQEIDLNISELGTFTDLVDMNFLDENLGFWLGSDGQVIRTQDGGDTWELISDILTFDATRILFSDNLNEYILTNYTEYFKTTDGGITWTSESLNLYGDIRTLDFNPSSGKPLGVGFGSSCCVSSPTGGSLIIRENSGSTGWDILSYIQGGSAEFNSFDVKGDQRIVFNQSNGYYSENGGVTWIQIPNPPESFSSDQVLKVHLESNGILAANYSGIFRTVDNGANWTLLSGDVSGNFQVVDGVIFGRSAGNELSVSNDAGATWTSLGPLPVSTFAFKFIDQNIGFAYDILSIYRTTDGGATWNLAQVEDDDSFIRSIDFFGSVGIAGTNNGVIYRSTDQGQNWFRVNTTLLETDIIAAVDENTWFSIEENSDQLYVSRDQGDTWINSYHFEDDVNRIFSDQGKSYFIGAGSTFLEMKMKEQPSLPSPIDGNAIAYSGREELYTLSVPSSTVNYSWEVEGNNSLSYSGPEAQITWNELGTFVVKVTPSDECAQGTAREMTVEVVPPPPSTIQGDDIVGNFSTENYSVDFMAGVTYEWFVTGAVSFTPNQNNLTVNWDENVWGLITLVITDNATGLRTISSFRVAVGNALGVDDEALESVSIYPNPTSEYVIVRTPNATDVQLKIFDIVGKEIFPERSKSQDHLLIDLQKMKSGVYFLHIEIDGKRTIRKVIKN